jgi:hypothetical protein
MIKIGLFIAVSVLALTAFLVSGLKAEAQTREQRVLIDEIVRKAEAREPETGFCAKTGWPSGDDPAMFARFLKAAKVGSWKVNAFRSGTCTYDRVTSVHMENGGKCVSYRAHSCVTGKFCSAITTIDCLDRNGNFVLRRPG